MTRTKLRRQDRRSMLASASPWGRLGTMIVMLVVLAMMINRAADPQTWRWLAALDADPADTPPPASNSFEETIVPGPDDRDDAQDPDVLDEFAAVGDQAALAPTDMPAYWRCMRWSLSQSFDELEQRALKDVAFTQMWEQPDQYRGKLIRLDLHIRRVLEYPATENSANVKKVYEVWGATNESRTFPYVVVCPELPPGVRVAADLHQRGVFVGYFVKTLAFTAADNKRHASPLLVGRLEAVAAPVVAAPVVSWPSWPWLVTGAAVVCVAAMLWRRLAAVRPRRLVLSSTDEQTAESWFARHKDASSQGGG